MKIRAPQGSVGCATPSVSGPITMPHAVRRPNSAGPLAPASATYEPSGRGALPLWCRVCALIREGGRSREERQPRERDLAHRERRPHPVAAPSRSPNDSRTSPSKSMGSEPVGSA